MAGKKQLPPVWVAGAVDAQETPGEPAGPLSLSEAAESGTRLDELRALRRILITHMEHENTLARDLAALTRQVREISKEIEEIVAQEAEAAKSGTGGPHMVSRLDAEGEEFNPHSA